MKIALRSLLKSPGFTVVSLVTLALGIGLTTTQFTVLNRLLLQPLPYPNPETLVQMWSATPQNPNGPVAPGDFCDLRDQATSFRQLAVFYVNYQKSLAEPGYTPERATAMAVTADYFLALEVAPMLGRSFTAADAAERAPVVVLSHAYWQKHLAGAPAALGRTLRFDGQNVTVIGIMPEILDDPLLTGGTVDLWHLDAVEVNRDVRDKAWYSLLGRLKPGVTPHQAQSELQALAARLARDHPATNAGRSARLAPFAPNSLDATGRSLIWLILGLAAAVLLIACINLANLQLVRATGRAREYAVRLALGASRRQLMSQLLTESLLLAGAGGALGLLVAIWGNRYFAAYFGFPIPVDLRVLGFALAAALFAGVSSGCLPAWLATRANVQEALKQGGRSATAGAGRHRLRRSLIVLELALALTLLAGAGFFVRGLDRITQRDLHWRPENVLSGYLELPYERYGDETNARHEVFARKTLAVLRELPGVDAATLSLGTPVSGPSEGLPVALEGQAPPTPGQEAYAVLVRADPGYLDTFGIRLVQGRNFTANDRGNTPPVALISESMARQFWPGQNPLGRRFRNASVPDAPWLEVVGVTADLTFATDYASQFPALQIVVPWAQRSSRFVTISLRSSSDARALAEPVRRAFAGIEPDVAFTQLDTATHLIDSYLSGLALVRRTLIAVASLGLLLAAVGIYGVIANLTLERTSEIGIRMALGAQHRDVLWLFLRQGLVLALVGAAVGVGLALALLRLLSQHVAIVPGNDPWMLAGLALLLTGVAALACWLPARKATRVDPIIALRAD